MKVYKAASPDEILRGLGELVNGLVLNAGQLHLKS